MSDLGFGHKLSLIFTDKKYQLGELKLDALLTESHQFNAEITEHPVEAAGSFCDHIYTKPLEVSIEGFITNTPMEFLGLALVHSVINENNDHAQVAFKKLEQIFFAREPISITTTLKDYSDMVLQSLSVDRGPLESGFLQFKATARQIRTVNQSLIALKEPKVERAKTIKKMGKQETSNISPQEAMNNKSSLMSALIKKGMNLF